MSKSYVLWGFIVLLLACFSFLSDVITVTGYNFIYWFQNQIPESVVIIVLFFIIIGLIYWVKSIYRQNNKLKSKAKELENKVLELEAERLSKADKSLLEEFLQTFNDKLYNFTEMLVQTRQLSFNQMQNLENDAVLFGYPHKKFENERLETAKRILLDRLNSFLDFYSTHTISTTAPTIVRFKPKTEKDEKDYQTKLKEFYESWETFMKVVGNETRK
ncbi:MULTISPECIES: hypothetical protein [Bacillus]|uniref:hypothetical protein n=1 Tax=Bacillus TaxID=1386 RepID=UPI0006AD9BED|nr:MULTISPECIES: hypothetical protein [Bacillus]AWD87954.1 hypothetical protein BVQ_10990 [Bacillus velezensis]KAF6690668.1 hypothetical protein G9362_16625 [Bacillus sp. EKM601B]KOS49139.1 hypothetical protein AN272_20175 [Bacillus amyloliquefaciens]MBA9149752.1 hypothetical protein [Bacillus sp. EKM213B]MEC1018660.1 hypothetical protein [Bacillus velezensis]